MLFPSCHCCVPILCYLCTFFVWLITELLRFISLPFSSFHTHFSHSVLCNISPSLPLPVHSLFLLCGIPTGGEWVWLCESDRSCFGNHIQSSFLVILLYLLAFSSSGLHCNYSKRISFFFFFFLCEIISLKLIYYHIFVNKENGWIFRASLCLYWCKYES